MLASSFTEHLREILKVKWNCLLATRASHVRRDAGHVDVEVMAAHFFFFYSVQLQHPVNLLNTRPCTNKHH